MKENQQKVSEEITKCEALKFEVAQMREKGHYMQTKLEAEREKNRMLRHRSINDYKITQLQGELTIAKYEPQTTKALLQKKEVI